MNCQAVLFDFDYTLGDSTEPIVSSYVAALQEMGWKSPEREAVRLTIGQTLQDGYTTLTGDQNEMRRQEFFQRFRTHSVPIMAKDTLLFPGAVEILNWLDEKSIPCGVVSTKSRDVLESIFQRQNLLDKLSVIVGFQDIQHAKPDPEGLVSALTQLDIAPPHALYCGDTILDAEASFRGGLPFCAVLNGTTPASAFSSFPSEYIADDLIQLFQWLKTVLE